MIRREIREKAFMFLFQLELQKGDESQQMTEFVASQEIGEQAIGYFSRLVNGVCEHQQELDESFIPFLKGWTKDRLPKVDLSIMRLAAYEILFVDEVPDNVAISEAVLLAKKFSSEESRSYINAVLGRVSRQGLQTREEIIADVSVGREEDGNESDD